MEGSMPERESITAEYVRSRLSYDPESGVLQWKPITGHRWAAAWNAKFAGTAAGRVDSTGYIQVAINAKRYPATHLIWIIVTGAWPVAMIDHKNRCRTDNRLINLREASRTENIRNSGPKRPFYKGVKRTSSIIERWQARISVGGEYKHLGVFDTPREAAVAYDNASREFFGEFACPNFGERT
jgi:hypothetical protein